MTVVSLYSIFDRKAVSFAPPFVAANQSVAARMCMASAMSADSLLSQYPEDFEVYELGAFDQSSGRFEPLEHPLLLCNFAALISAAQRSAVKADEGKAA